jgi:hypothetical protein
MQTATGSAIAAGAIVACLIDTLVTKGVLTREDVGVMLGNALPRLGPFGQTPDIGAARETITGIAAMYAKRDR